MRYPLSLRPIGFPQIDRYPELRELELRHLASELVPSVAGPTLGLLKAKIRSYAHGEFPHAEHILSTLYELIENYGLVKAMSFPEAAESPDQQATNGRWEGLKWVLASSMTSGTFLDSQFYAVESRSSTGLPKIRPVYFCSRVDRNFASRLVARKSLPWVICGWVVDPPSQIPRNS